MEDASVSSYDGFLSYSHAADDLLAPRLQAGLQRFAKPWWKRRALHIFRDEASLSANPHLWSSITDALDDSDWFVLLLSPEAAQSEWVNREIDYWREHRDPARILPVVTDGEFGWVGGEVTGNAAPASLRGVFADEPRWVDLRFARTETQLDLRHTKFRDAVADIAAAVRGVPKDELESEEIRQHRRTVRTAWTAGIAILALGIAATVGAVVAFNAQQEAEDSAALAQQNATLAEERRQDAESIAEAEAEARAESETQRLIAEQERERAEEQAAIALANAELARSRELAASAINVLDDDPELSVLLALEAAQGVDPAFESVSALHEAMQNHRTVRTIEWPADWNWQGFLDGSISPDGSLVAVSGFLNRMAVWDLDAASDEPLWTFEVPYPDYAVILPVFNIDGSHVIATVAWSSWAEPPEDWPEPPSEVGLYVLDSRTGEVISHYRGPDCPIVRLYQSGRYIDEHRLVAASAPAEGECTAIDTPMSDVWLLDLQTGQMTLAYEDPGDAVGWPTDLSLSEDSKYLSFIEEPMSRVVDLETGLEVFAAPGGIYSVLNRDGTRLLAANESTITLWDIATATELQGYSAEARLTSPSFNPDETLVYATGYDGAVRVWDTATGELLHELKGHDQFTLYPSMTSDSARLASFSGDRTVRIWDVTASGEGEVNGFDFPGRMVVQSGRVVGDRAAVLLYQDPLDWAEPATALVFDPSTGETIRTFEGYGGQMVRLSPDGKLLAGQPFVAEGVLGPIHLRDVESGEVLVKLDGFCTWIVDEGPGPECEEDPTTVGDNLEWLAFSPDGSMLAMSGYNSGTSGVWDVESGRRLVTFGLAPGEWYNFEFNPTSDLLVGTSGNQLTDQFVVYDTDGWAELASGPDGGLATTFTPDGRYVFVDTWDGVQKIDTTTWQPVGEIMPVDSLIRDIAVSSDGTLIAHGGQSGVVRIRSTLTGELLQEIRLPGAVALIEFVQDRHLLIVPFNRALVMTADTSELVDVARSQVTRGFTADECVTYYIDPCPDLETIRGG